jgi:hypothetical protein
MTIPTPDPKKEAELKDIFNKVILSEGVKVSQEEGLTDELEIIARTNAIREDAILETPVTEAGIKVRAIADKAVSDIENGIPSPYTPKIKFDYNKHRDETATVAIEQILKEILPKFDNLVAHMTDDETRRELVDEEYSKASFETLQILTKNNVGIAAFKYVFEMLRNVVTTLEQDCMNQVNGHRTEIMARLLRAKNPGTGDFDPSYATYQQVVDLVMNTREEIPGDIQGYGGGSAE